MLPLLRYCHEDGYSFVLQVEKTDSTGGEFTLDIYVKEKNDKPCRLKVSLFLSLLSRFSFLSEKEVNFFSHAGVTFIALVLL